MPKENLRMKVEIFMSNCKECNKDLDEWDEYPVGDKIYCQVCLEAIIEKMLR